MSRGALRGSSRGRGRGRGSGRGGRGGKRKRIDDDDEIKANDDSDDTDGSEDEDSFSQPPTTTKSGRSVQKPTTFAPPPAPSPTSNNLNINGQSSGLKRKRTFHSRKNADSAVCSVCQRPHSPATNMIVFCDGCNTPWHRYCHRPPIAQEVVDVPEMEWFCAQCRAEMVPEVDVETFISGEGATDAQVSCRSAGLLARFWD